MKGNRHFIESPLRMVAWLAALAWSTFASSASSPETLDRLFAEKKWEASAQAAYEVLVSQPSSGDAAAKGAFSLFQKGYPNAALVFLKKLTPTQWQQLRAKDADFVELISLLQKKIPMTVLNTRIDGTEAAGSYLRDENLFAKGREAFENKRWNVARESLNAINSSSRYFSSAHYLLAVAAVEEKNYDMAALEITRMFEPTTLGQSTEFWRNLRSEVSQEAGASLSVMLDPNILNRLKHTGQLGTMAISRIHYARKEFDLAIQNYDKVPPGSPYYSRAQLEKIWTYLQMNQHEKAAELAKQVGNDDNFEAVEAKMIHAIIFADKKDSAGARQQVKAFLDVHEKLNTGLQNYLKFGIRKALPTFVNADLESDKRVQELLHYEKVLATETGRLRKLSGLYPVYGVMAGNLDLLRGNVDKEVGRVTREVIQKRIEDLKALYVQAKLVRAETFLEDRESLRLEFRKKNGITEEMRQEHDRQLVQLLTTAVNEVEEVLPLMREKNLFLQFRQAELLWELGRAHLILAQSEAKEKNIKIGEKYQTLAVKHSEDIADNYPKFPKHNQAVFFTGFSQLELGQDEKAIKNLTKYTQLYPNHDNVADAYRILADYEFDRNNFAKSIQLYNQVLRFDESQVVGYAYYKIAWAAYNIQDYAKAMLSLEKAILWANKSKGASHVVSLKREAKRDLITIYSEIGDAKQAYQYFERFIGEGTYDWANDLAKAYDESGQYEKAVYLFNVLIALDKSPEKNLEHYAAIIRCNMSLGRWTEVAESAKILAENYKKELKTPTAEGTIPFDAEKALRDASLAQHFEFKATEEPEVIERILALDRYYFDSFIEWPTAQDPLYKHAYFLYQKKRYPEAVEAYKTHWSRFKAQLKEPVREEAVRNLINGLEKLEAEKTEKVADIKAGEGAGEEGKGKKEDKPKQPGIGDLTEISTEAQEIVDFAGEYVKEYPKNEHTRTIAFLRASMLLKYSKMEEGIKETQAIFDADVDDKFGKAAIQNLRVAYYKQKNWESTFNWATAMLERPDPKMRPYHKDLGLIREESLFLWADKTEDHVAAAKLFLKAARDPRMNRLKQNSLFNAIIRYHKAEEKIQVLDLSKELEAMGAPAKELVAELNGIRAAMYQEAGDYVTALPLFEKFLAKPGKDVTPDVLQQARLNTALIAQGAGKKKEAVTLYNQYIQGEKDKESAGVRQAQAALKYIQAQVNRKPAATYSGWAALEAKRQKFEAAPLPAKGSLGARIKQGAANLEGLVKQFFDVSASPETPVHFAYEAYCSVPYLYQAFSREVLKLGAGVPEASREAVTAQLRKVTDPMDERVLATAKDCIEKSVAARHTGPIYHEVNKQWGWEQDAGEVQLVTNFVDALAGGSPWIQPAPIKRTEAQIIQSHLEGKGDLDSWYSLGLIRMNEGKWQLGRLTLIDALSKKPEENGENPTIRTLKLLSKNWRVTKRAS
ncbi:MAG: tetratricopeptide repeat protein [Bdellovibrionota bacterium]